jgi:hypothetical protein
MDALKLVLRGLAMAAYLLQWSHLSYSGHTMPMPEEDVAVVRCPHVGGRPGT